MPGDKITAVPAVATELTDLIFVAAKVIEGQDNENYQVPAALFGTGSASSTVPLIAGETLAVNDLCYLSSSGKLLKAQSSVITSVKGLLVFAKEVAVLDEVKDFQVSGILAGFTGLAPGDTYYVSPTTPGGITNTLPAVSGEWVRIVGYAVSETELLIYLSPTFFRNI
ncbi:hypothetical protein [Kiloniella sp.]|uniref:hypothetical protein n=1 Tax=Kiloniella sp. TaxID=1938587 RepID=UPI003B01F1CB